MYGNGLGYKMTHDQVLDSPNKLICLLVLLSENSFRAAIQEHNEQDSIPFVLTKRTRLRFILSYSVPKQNISTMTLIVVSSIVRLFYTRIFGV